MKNLPTLDAEEVSTADILQTLLEAHDMTASDLGRLLGERTLGHLLGERTLGHNILTGKRKLTTKQVRTLAGHFKVSAELLI